MKALPIEQVVQRLVETNSRYQNLRDLFGEFCDDAEKFAAVDADVQGITLDHDEDGNSLNVEFCGTAYRFSFNVDELGNGVIECDVMHSGEDAEPILSVVFDEQGEGDLMDSDDVLMNLRDGGPFVLEVIHRHLYPREE